MDRCHDLWRVCVGGIGVGTLKGNRRNIENKRNKGMISIALIALIALIAYHTQVCLSLGPILSKK